ncbi:TraR/DksA family transcriptional regulator [Billgrantia bachuensis]|uniref:RNA polymerase-binding protein DksA n=1 Tax=Billgrantia bachuensis TaxID=2717286 RepID=A0ABX0PYB0_9GAMM|nr:TraR/DksA C4-type zinc finger protein [Halomonas bachuensis]NIC07058.1 RNA polymerase-binding protein DksA [Halomonas bachuensis]
MQADPRAQRLLAMPEEAYMNDEQLAFFQARLLAEQAEVEAHLDEVRKAVADNERSGDELDRAAVEEELRLLLRQADRETRLLRKIAQALRCIEAGDYGYCAETGQPIGLARLMLRPTAELCLEAKERQEKREHHYSKLRGDQ